MSSFNVRKGFRNLTSGDLRSIYKWVRDYVGAMLGSVTSIYTGDGTIPENRVVTITEDNTLRMEATSSIAPSAAQSVFIGDRGDNTCGVEIKSVSDSFGVTMYPYLNATEASINLDAYSSAGAYSLIQVEANGECSLYGSPDGVNEATIGVLDTVTGFLPVVSGTNGALVTFANPATDGGKLFLEDAGGSVPTFTLEVVKPTGNESSITGTATSTSAGIVLATLSTAFGSDTSISIGITSNSAGNSFTIVEADEFETGSSFSLINGEAEITFNGTSGSSGLTLSDNGTTSSIQFAGALGGAMVITSADSYPLQYNADYSANISTRSIPDVGYIQSLTGRYVDAAAAVTGGVVVGEVWFNTTTNKYMVRLS